MAKKSVAKAKETGRKRKLEQEMLTQNGYDGTEGAAEDENGHDGIEGAAEDREDEGNSPENDG